MKAVELKPVDFNAASNLSATPVQLSTPTRKQNERWTKHLSEADVWPSGQQEISRAQPSRAEQRKVIHIGGNPRVRKSRTSRELNGLHKASRNHIRPRGIHGIPRDITKLQLKIIGHCTDLKEPYGLRDLTKPHGFFQGHKGPQRS